MASLVLLVSELLRIQNPDLGSVETILYSCSLPAHVATKNFLRNEADKDFEAKDLQESRICVDMINLCNHKREKDICIAKIELNTSKGFVMLKDACAMGLVDIPGT
ncbi:hypothetical protein WN944_004466 [Citrus x changshan-huyou]|uniref:Uncharacterized protein n=1 Tax=Citrus x changshan-huyou TaxID=2935761 RepID=A0AAP0QIY9_9ROSI